MNEPLLSPRDLAHFKQLDNIVKKSSKAFVECGIALSEIKRRKLWQAEFDSWEDYCSIRLDASVAYVTRTMAAAQLVESLPKRLAELITTESVARELLKVDPSQICTILKEIRESDMEVTAKAVSERVEKAQKQQKLDQENQSGTGETALPIGNASSESRKSKAESTNPAPASPPAEPKPAPIIVDKLGYPIPERAMPTWDRFDEVQELLTTISRLKSKIKAAQDTKDPLYHEVVFSDALSSLERVYTTIGTAKPFAVCTTCQGQNVRSCTFCGGRGMISQFRFTRTVPIEIREMRMKAVTAYEAMNNGKS